MLKTTNFDQYFESIKNTTGKKVGELDKAPGKITSIAEYKSPKSGKNSLKITISVDGSDVFTYLGYSSEKSAEISKGRLVKLAIAAVGMDETKKIYEAAANDEDVEKDEEFIVEFATKLNKKIKKNPVDVVVTRKKEGDFWDTKWFIPNDPIAENSEGPKTECQDGEKFLEDLVENN